MNLFVRPLSAISASGDSGPINVPQSISILQLVINVTAVGGTTPTLDVFIEGQDENNFWYTMYHPAQINAPIVVPQSIGKGAQTPVPVPDTIRVRWVIGGTAGPNVTTGISLVGEP